MRGEFGTQKCTLGATFRKIAGSFPKTLLVQRDVSYWPLVYFLPAFFLTGLLSVSTEASVENVDVVT